MFNLTSRRIFQTVFVTGILAIASLGYAEAPNPVFPKSSRHPEPPPSATPTVTPSSMPLLGQIQVQGPKEPIRVEAEIQPVEAKPLEIKPLQIQLPNQDLHVTAAGIPDKIKVEWDAKPISVDLRWPKEPIKISMDGKSNATELKDSELTKRVKTLESEINNNRNQINTLNDKLITQRDNYRDTIERQRNSGNLTDAQVGQLMRDLSVQRIEWWGKPLWIFLWMILSGAVGGFSLWLVDNFRRDRFYSPSPLIKRLFFWVPEAVLGIVAALMVPAVLYFLPGKSLQAAAQNGYLLVSLCSVCFVVAMVGELFIVAVLRRLRRLLWEWSEN